MGGSAIKHTFFHQTSHQHQANDIFLIESEVELDENDVFQSGSNALCCLFNFKQAVNPCLSFLHHQIRNHRFQDTYKTSSKKLFVWVCNYRL